MLGVNATHPASETPQSHQPESHSADDVVGHYFAARNFEHMRTEIYFCDSPGPENDYLMTNVNDPKDRRDVSPHAFGRTWLRVEDHGDHWWVPESHLRIEKWALADSAPPSDERFRR